MGHSDAEAMRQGKPVNQELELEYPKRLETFVVLAVNYVGLFDGVLLDYQTMRNPSVSTPGRVCLQE